MSVNRCAPLEWLQHWFRAQCDGKWEHCCGVQIESLANPGWQLTIDVEGTYLEGRPHPEITHKNAPNDWLTIRLENGKYCAAGDTTKLMFLVEHFREWAERERELASDAPDESGKAGAASG